jgi:hypothetical protein
MSRGSGAWCRLWTPGNRLRAGCYSHLLWTAVPDGWDRPRGGLLQPANSPDREPQEPARPFITAPEKKAVGARLAGDPTFQ